MGSVCLSVWLFVISHNGLLSQIRDTNNINVTNTFHGSIYMCVCVFVCIFSEITPESQTKTHSRNWISVCSLFTHTFHRIPHCFQIVCCGLQHNAFRTQINCHTVWKFHHARYEYVYLYPGFLCALSGATRDRVHLLRCVSHLLWSLPEWAKCKVSKASDWTKLRRSTEFDGSIPRTHWKEYDGAYFNDHIDLFQVYNGTTCLLDITSHQKSVKSWQWGAV